MVRSDGVIFPHDKENFTYCPEPEPSLYDQPESKRLRLDMLQGKGIVAGGGTQGSASSASQDQSSTTAFNETSSFNPNASSNASAPSVPLQINYSSSQFNPTVSYLDQNKILIQLLLDGRH